jgi:hypothetical protein
MSGPADSLGRNRIKIQGNDLPGEVFFQVIKNTAVPAPACFLLLLPAV